jgi:hypothetical protein
MKKVALESIREGIKIKGIDELHFTQNSLVQEASQSIDLSKNFEKVLDISEHQIETDFSSSEI